MLIEGGNGLVREKKSSGPQITPSFLQWDEIPGPFYSPKESTRFQRVCGHPNLLSIVGMEVSFKVQNCSIQFAEITVSIDKHSNMSISFPQIFFQICRLPPLYQRKLGLLELCLCRSFMGENRLLSLRPVQFSSADGRRVHAPSG